jgi:Lar family restriction alleviation protein
MEPFLYNCPFCGSNNIAPADTRGFPVQVECRNCRAEGPAKLTSPEAGDAWNERPVIVDPQAAADALACVLDASITMQPDQFSNAMSEALEFAGNVRDDQNTSVFSHAPFIFGILLQAMAALEAGDIKQHSNIHVRIQRAVDLVSGKE